MNLDAIATAVIDGNDKEVKNLVAEQIEAHVPAGDILDCMTSALDEVGAKFSRGEIFVPEMLIAAKAMQAGTDILEPHLTEAGITPGAKAVAVMGTVKGDLHDIGKNLVTIMLKSAGFDVHDIGIDMPPENFIKAAQENNAQLIGLSALLTTTMPAMKDTVEALRSAGIKAKIIIGGSPVTAEYAEEIGADGYAPDALAAVDVAKNLVQPVEILT